MALGYSERSPSSSTFVSSPIRIWGNARVSGADDEDRSQDYSFAQFNGAIGADYKLTRDLVVGVIGGYEDFRFKLDNVGKLDGDGLSIGGYAAWRFAPSLRVEGGVSRSFLNYDANAGTASGSFDGDRWIYLAGLTGNYSIGNVLVEPGSSVVWLNEEQDRYTDSLGTAHSVRSFTEGRVATGAKVSMPVDCDYLLMRPYAGLYADYYFSDDDAQLRTVPTFGISDGCSARAIAGAEFMASHDSPWSMTLGGELGNIGSGDGLIPTGRAGASLRY